ncbi:MAG TPA: YceI family protein [Paenalcaligenes sp.]|nr:YceI family protein [Paenalcaligenes sp.]
MFNHKKIVSTACAAIFAATASVAVAEPVTYQADPTHTFAHFSYDHMGLSRQSSSFENTSGVLTLDLEEQTGDLQVEIDLRSVNTGAQIFNDHLQGEEFFDTENHPTATFESTKIIFDGDAPVAVEGELTIKGITQEVTFELDHYQYVDEHPMLKRPAIGANATTTIKRTEFDIDKYVPAVSDEVVISVSFEGIAQDNDEE